MSVQRAAEPQYFKFEGHELHETNSDDSSIESEDWSQVHAEPVYTGAAYTESSDVYDDEAEKDGDVESAKGSDEDHVVGTFEEKKPRATPNLR